MPTTDNPTRTVLDPAECTPRTAGMHVQLAPVRNTAPARRRGVWPFQPWRFVLVATSIVIAIPCGIGAVAPVWNGADLGLLISLAIFAAAFTLPGKD